jgi:hypothetical protein
MSDIKKTTIEATTNDSPPKVTVRLNGELGTMRAGGNGHDGDVALFDANTSGDDLIDFSKANIQLDGSSGHARLGGTTDSSGRLTLRGSGLFSPFVMEIGGNEAEMTLTPNLSSNVSIHLKGDSGSLHLRSATPPDQVIPASLILFDGEGRNHLQLDAETGDLTMRARLANDGSQSGANLKLIDGKGKQQIHLDGHTGNISLNGDIFLNGGDCAENFAMTGSIPADAGTVVIIRDEETLAASNKPYDKRVAGVIAGAGTRRPGIILNRDETAHDQRPISLMGRAYCKVDAGYASIEIGDLLTTSSTPGYAMKAADPQRAFGAVIGKALRPMREGRGMIPILIAMQ